MGDQSSHSPVPGYCTTGRLALGPLLKHLLHGLLHHLLVLVSVAVEGVLRDTAPDQRLRLRLVKIDDHRAFDVLLGRDATHATANATHAPCAVRGLLAHPATGDEDDVGVLCFLNHVEALARSEEHTSELQSLRHLV